jgi:DNA polymerase III epsilon subunit-like protein
MPKICFIYTDTNGLHKYNNFVSTKKLYKFARLIAFHYIIGEYTDNKFNQLLNKTIILKPKTINFDPIAQKFHKISYEQAFEKGIDNIEAMKELKNDLSNVKILVSHSLPFHIKALQVECFRTAVDINFSKFINIDMMSFNNSNNTFPKLVDLVSKYKISDKLSQIEQYRELFFAQYRDYTNKQVCKTIVSKPVSNTVDVDFID